jgi:hypothetical protein
MDQTYGPNGMTMNPGQAVDGLRIYVAASLNAGININAADITIGAQAINQMPFTANTFNWSAGRLAGWTTRYGINPVPGHNSNENTGTAIPANHTMSGYFMRGLVASEQSVAAHPFPSYDVYGSRTFLYGAVIVPLPVGGGAGGSTVPVVYWLSARTRGSSKQIDLLPTTNQINTGDRVGIRSNLEGTVGGGAAITSLGESPTASGANLNAPEITRGLQSVDRLGAIDIVSLRNIDTFTNKYIRFAMAQTSIPTNITEFMMDVPDDVPNDTTPYAAYFNSAGTPFWVNSKPQRKSVSFDVLEVQNGYISGKKWTNRWFLSQTPGDLVPTQCTNRAGDPNAPESISSGALDFLNVSNPYIVEGIGYGSNVVYFIRIDSIPVQTPVTMMGIITGRPMIALWNPYIRDSSENIGSLTPATTPYRGSNDFVQWLDPTQSIYAPQAVDTRNPLAVDYYTETDVDSPVRTQTCWGLAPLYLKGTQTANVVSPSSTPKITGVLVANTTYEYAYSVYNVLTGKESNVGRPAKAFITVSNSAINVDKYDQFPSIEDLGIAANAWYASSIAADNINYVRKNMPTNYLFYRLYFRELGSFEWLSAGQYSFANVYYGVGRSAIYIGVNNSGASGVGGQPGGYNDFSDLPTDDYIDVASFQGRMFWLTRGQLCWSRSDDLLSYPSLNFAGAPAGEFRGMLPHFFAGQAQQNGRLVVFSSNGTFEGRFTGELTQQQVRVSPTAQPQAVYVDGSDFILSQRGSETAFSGRSAVVAEGVLFFMGPTGIHRDDGVALPKRISQDIEPLVFESYDKTTTDQFFAYYNRRSGEVLFFYRPDPQSPDLNPQGYLTKAWVYSLRTESFGSQSDLVDFKGQTMGDSPGAWSQYGYNQLIDWAQDLDLTRFETVPHAPGVRTLIGSRRDAAATVSRPYYHDDDCSGGDYRPGDEMMVKEIQRPNAATVRFVLASGYSATILAAVAVGTKIAIQNSTVYGDMLSTANVDGYFVVKAKGAGYVDIEASGSLPAILAQTFTTAQYFPMFVDGFHGVSCVLQTHYLAPEGIFTWHALRWLHILIKPVPTMQGTVIPYVTAQWAANHQQVTSTATKNLNLLALNSRETTTQIITDIPSPNMEAQGQAVRTTLTYNQLAGRWTFYMVAGYYESAPNDTKMYQREYG